MFVMRIFVRVFEILLLRVKLEWLIVIFMVVFCYWKVVIILFFLFNLVNLFGYFFFCVFCFLIVL